MNFNKKKEGGSFFSIFDKITNTVHKNENINRLCYKVMRRKRCIEMKRYNYRQVLEDG